jgi:hypothetical protein
VFSVGWCIITLYKLQRSLGDQHGDTQLLLQHKSNVSLSMLLKALQIRSYIDYYTRTKTAARPALARMSDRKLNR